jgi:aspartate/methionine/tyrosine aminotransferase
VSGHGPADGTAAVASTRATTLQPSAIREVFEAAQRLGDAIRLEVGEPDFPTPPWVVEAAARAARDGATHYTPNAGVAVLREALADKVQRVNGWPARPDECIVTAGGVQALHLALAALLDPGDEVLLPDPLWPNFAMIAHLVSARVRTYRLRPEDGFRPSPAEIEACIGERTRVLVLNFPSNPTGACLAPDDLAALVEVARRHGLWVVADECYDELTFSGRVVSAQACAPYERTVTVHTFSKTYAMTGWRVGYAFAPAPTLAVMARMQEPFVSCVNAPAQYAALAALTGPQDVVGAMRDVYGRRAGAAVALLTQAGVPVHRPEGAFYLWVDTSADDRDSATLAQDLLVAERVAVAPGLAFGPSGRNRVRLSLASADDDLLEGCRRLARFLGTSRS